LHFDKWILFFVFYLLLLFERWLLFFLFVVHTYRHQASQYFRLRIGWGKAFNVRTLEKSEDQVGWLWVQQSHYGRSGYDVSVCVGISALYESRKNVTPEVLLRQRHMVNGLRYIRGTLLRRPTLWYFIFLNDWIDTVTHELGYNIDVFVRIFESELFMSKYE
jgi:hypothetical protein